MGGRSRKVRGGGDGEEEPRTAGGRAEPRGLSPSERLWGNKQMDWAESKPIKSPESAHVLRVGLEFPDIGLSGKKNPDNESLSIQLN